MNRLVRTFAMSAALLVAGCAAQTPPVQVTRFHLGQPIARGEIAVEPRDRGDSDSLAFQAMAAPVRNELGQIGFTAAADLRHSELVAVVGVSRGTRTDPSDRSGVRVGIGGSSIGGGVGLGGGITFPLGRRRPSEVVGTELSVQIKRRSDGTVMWEGRARSEARAGTPDAAPEAAVARLAHALFTGFPGESGRTITVP